MSNPVHLVGQDVEINNQIHHIHSGVYLHFPGLEVSLCLIECTRKTHPNSRIFLVAEYDDKDFRVYHPEDEPVISILGAVSKNGHKRERHYFV